MSRGGAAGVRGANYEAGVERKEVRDSSKHSAHAAAHNATPHNTVNDNVALESVIKQMTFGASALNQGLLPT
jgi:hypothetical protein